IEQTRSLASDFYPVALERYGFRAALMELADKAGRPHAIPCVVRMNGDAASVDITDATRIQLFRIAQEAVFNAVRHARPNKVLIRLAARNGDIVLTVKDDGRGLPADLDPNEGSGLRIMRYRAAMIGGEFDVRNAQDGGVTVTCTVPVHR